MAEYDYAGEHELRINGSPIPFFTATVDSGKGGYRKRAHQTSSQVKMGRVKQTDKPVGISIDFGIFLEEAPDLRDVQGATFTFTPTEPGGKVHMIENVDYAGDGSWKYSGEDSGSSLKFEGTNDSFE